MKDPAPASDGDDVLALDRGFSAQPGSIERVSARIRRLVADNRGPFTFTGTCTYVVGDGSIAIIDPGPDDQAHIAGLLAAVRGETVTHILVTHTHRDHSAGAARLKALTGAAIVGCMPHAESGRPTELASLDAANDRAYRPDRILDDGDELRGDGFTLRAVATPGHAANHLAFAFAEERALFSGDHVMGWSTSIVAPPDGSMAAYMASLQKLLDRSETVYWPGHGGPVQQPHLFVKSLIRHRRKREASILAAVGEGARDIPTLVTRLYTGLDGSLVPAAALTILAHLEDLVARRLIVSDGPVRLGSHFEAQA